MRARSPPKNRRTRADGGIACMRSCGHELILAPPPCQRPLRPLRSVSQGRAASCSESCCGQPGFPVAPHTATAVHDSVALTGTCGCDVRSAHRCRSGCRGRLAAASSSTPHANSAGGRAALRCRVSLSVAPTAARGQRRPGLHATTLPLWRVSVVWVYSRQRLPAQHTSNKSTN